MSLVGKLNRTWRPVVDEKACIELGHGGVTKGMPHVTGVIEANLAELLLDDVGDGARDECFA